MGFMFFRGDCLTGLTSEIPLWTYNLEGCFLEHQIPLQPHLNLDVARWPCWQLKTLGGGGGGGAKEYREFMKKRPGQLFLGV